MVRVSKTETPYVSNHLWLPWYSIIKRKLHFLGLGGETIACVFLWVERISSFYLQLIEGFGRKGIEFFLFKSVLNILTVIFFHKEMIKAM